MTSTSLEEFIREVVVSEYNNSKRGTVAPKLLYPHDDFVNSTIDNLSMAELIKYIDRHNKFKESNHNETKTSL